MVELLLYQDGSTLLADEDHNSTKVLDSATTTESRNHLAPRHSREVFTTGHPSGIRMPQAPDIQDGEKTLSNISHDTSAPTGEIDEQKAARERKNRA